MSVSVIFRPPRAELAALVLRVNEKRDRAIVLVGHQIAHDAVFEEPRPPIDTGQLRGSTGVRLEGDAARVSFNVDHALYMHETGEAASRDWPSREIDPGVGPKFLEVKLLRNKSKYNKLAAREMK